MQQRRGIVISSETASRIAAGVFPRVFCQKSSAWRQRLDTLPRRRKITRGWISAARRGEPVMALAYRFHRSFESILINSTEPCVARYRLTDASA